VTSECAICVIQRGADWRSSKGDDRRSEYGEEVEERLGSTGKGLSSCAVVCKRN